MHYRRDTKDNFIMNEMSITPATQSAAASLLVATNADGTDARLVTSATWRVASIVRLGSASSHVPPDIEQSSVKEKLFHSRASFKVLFSQIAMHLDSSVRSRLFSQIDNLLDASEWVKSDAPISPESFNTFIRLLLFVKPDRRPGVGSDGESHLITTWTVRDDHLTIYCLPLDKIKWTVRAKTDGIDEHAAGSTSLARLLEVLQPYSPQRWFANAHSKHPI
jgi:hypothetical protein